jgi:hypothetical protein
MDNATKLLLMATTLFKLICLFRPPVPSPLKGEKVDHKFPEKMRSFNNSMTHFRKQMLNAVRYLHESHLIVCKYILAKIEKRGVE